MLHIRTVPTLTRAGAGIPVKRLLFSGRLRSTVTSASATQTEAQDGVNSRTGGQHVSARSGCAGEPGRGRRDGITTGANDFSVNFDQTREAYKSKDSLELLRSLVVFKLCSYDFLVDKNKEVMVLSYHAARCYDIQSYPFRMSYRLSSSSICQDTGHSQWSRVVNGTLVVRVTNRWEFVKG